MEGSSRSLGIENIQILFNILQTGHVDGDRHLIQILSVTPSNEGSYSCVAENVIGHTYQVAFLLVSGIPQVLGSKFLLPFLFSMLL